MNIKSKSKFVFWSATLSSSVTVSKFPFTSDNSKINSFAESTKGGLHVKLTKNSLKLSEAQAAVHGDVAPIFEFAAGTGLFNT